MSSAPALAINFQLRRRWFGSELPWRFPCVYKGKAETPLAALEPPVKTTAPLPPPCGDDCAGNLSSATISSFHGFCAKAAAEGRRVGFHCNAAANTPQPA